MRTVKMGGVMSLSRKEMRDSQQLQTFEMAWERFLWATYCDEEVEYACLIRPPRRRTHLCWGSCHIRVATRAPSVVSERVTRRSAVTTFGMMRSWGRVPQIANSWLILLICHRSRLIPARVTSLSKVKMLEESEVNWF